MISAIIGLILLVGGITLYRTFALYEEKKEFNVLRGRVPAFSNNDMDIKLAFTIDGMNKSDVKFPNRNDGYGVSDVVCKNEVTADWDNKLWGLVNIENPNENNKQIECTLQFVTGIPLSKTAKPGDYVTYNPPIKNYAIGTETGSNVQTIDPSELNLWRVLKINEDGTIDIISEYTSSKAIIFQNMTGWNNYKEVLTTISAQYENTYYTVGSRYPGYNEESIGADNLNIANILGNSAAKALGTDTFVPYWYAQTSYNPNDGGTQTYSVYLVCQNNTVSIICNNDVNNRGVLWNTHYGNYGKSPSNYLRPIVVLKSGLGVSGEGTKENPWVIN